MPIAQRPVSRAFRAVALTSIAGSAVALGTPEANIVPTEVARGAAEFARGASSTTITASDGAIINYSRFDVLTGESVQFIQPGADARVLNRVQSADPSTINGVLSANGIVYLVNPSGVVFGEGAVISAAGIVAAAGGSRTLTLSRALIASRPAAAW